MEMMEVWVAASAIALDIQLACKQYFSMSGYFAEDVHHKWNENTDSTWRVSNWSHEGTVWRTTYNYGKEQWCLQPEYLVQWE